MNRPFAKEENLFRDSVREFVDREVRPRVLDWESDGAIPRALFERLGELGFLGVRLSEEYGGAGLDFWYTTILIEELVRCGSVGVPVSILAHAEFATKVIDIAGTTDQKEEFLRPAVVGRKIGSLAVTEPDAGPSARLPFEMEMNWSSTGRKRISRTEASPISRLPRFVRASQVATASPW